MKVLLFNWLFTCSGCLAGENEGFRRKVVDVIKLAALFHGNVIHAFESYF
jgi:hypothetical protein